MTLKDLMEMPQISYFNYSYDEKIQKILKKMKIEE